MNVIISDVAALERLRASNAALSAIADGVLSTSAELADARSRGELVGAALIDHDANRPEPDPDVSDELAEILARNPGAASSADWIGRVRELQAGNAGALVAWEAERTILVQADAKVAGQVAAIEERLAAKREEHERVYLVFLETAREALVSEFEARWDIIASEVLQPLAALMSSPKLYGGGLHRLPFRRGIWGDCSLSIAWPENTPGGKGWKPLYPIDPRKLPPDTIHAFRETIGSAAGSTARVTRRSA